MAWWDRLGEEIAEAFDLCEGVFERACLGQSYSFDNDADRMVSHEALRHKYLTDAEFRKRCNARKESSRKLRMQADPEYAARRKAQVKASRVRRRRRHKRLMRTDPEYAEQTRAMWREQKRKAKS